ncbi:CvpA family protein [Lacunimicrobium album]
MIDLLLLVILGVVTWCVASEGPWGAAFTLIIVLISGLLAMNFFEPLAVVLEKTLELGSDWKARWDFIALSLLFAGGIFGLRAATDYLHPGFIPVHPLLHDGLRWGAGLLTGYVTMAILLTFVHTASLPRDFLGFKPERKNLLGIAAPDHQWLGFVQYVSENGMSRGKNGPIFDGPEYAVIAGQPPQIWPSFPIRYAYRREQIAGGSQAAAPVDPLQQMQPVNRRPAPGSGF